MLSVAGRSQAEPSSTCSRRKTWCPWRTSTRPSWKRRPRSDAMARARHCLCIRPATSFGCSHLHTTRPLTFLYTTSTHTHATISTPAALVDSDRCPEAQMSSLVCNPALYVTDTPSDQIPPLLRACLGARNHTTELALRAAPPTGRFTVVPAFPMLVANEPDADPDVDRCPFSAGRSLSAALDADPEATRPVGPVAVEGRPAPKPSGRLVCDLRGDVRAAVCACVDREGGT